MKKLFGTNGVRGIVNKDMNTELALRLGKAIGTWVGDKKIAIGTDTRLSNKMLENSVAAGLIATGNDVVFLGVAPTPAIQYYTKQKADFGIVITASHNPPEFNGIKCIDEDGTELIRWKEQEIEEIYFGKKFELSEWREIGDALSDNPLKMYKEAILSHVDQESIKKAGLKVVMDCANGAGCYVTPYLLRELGCGVITLNAQPDGTFPGHNSEPTKENLTDLISLVKETNADVGIAHDGDADRAIFVDENGRYLHGDRTLTLIAKKIVEEKGGLVVTPVSSSSSVKDVVKKAGGELLYTKVGSPIVAREMIERDAVFGGEENGGLIFSEHQYCRDAAMSSVKILELIASEGKLSELVDQLPNYALDKRGVECPDELKGELLERLKEEFRDEEYDDTDGLKIYYPEGWVLIRPSGTEPKYRVYSEAKNMSTAKNLGKKHQKILHSKIEDLR